MKKIALIAAAIAVMCSCKERTASEDKPVTVVNGVEILSHPRLLYTVEDASRINRLVRSDSQVKALQQAIITKADKLVAAEDVQSDDVNLSLSREYVNRVFTLGMAYRQSGNAKYSDKINSILNYLCSFDSWHPAHYLDVAEMTTAVAVGYDWCYDVLPEETRQKVRTSILTKALSIAEKEYETGDSGSYLKRETNWNVVCNTGMTLGALAVAEDYPDLAAKIVSNAPKFIPNCLKYFAPDGVCYEGPSYYQYTNIYLSMILKALNDNFDTDYGISDLEGVSKTAAYYVNTVSPSGLVFNFADTGIGAKASTSPLFFYFSRKFNIPQVAYWYRGQISDILAAGSLPSWHFPLALAWYDETPYTPVDTQGAWTYHNVNDILVLKGAPSNTQSIHLMAKGAKPSAAHQQCDGGTFVIESEGVRWLTDLGCDSYDIPGFWDYAPDGQRWNYFRNTSLGHNTIVINGKNQYSYGEAHLCAEDLSEPQPSAAFDLTPLYPEAESVIRRFTLTSDSSVEITDEVRVSEKSEIAWAAFSQCEASVDGNVVTLTKDGKSFQVIVTCPEGAAFTASQPQPCTEYENPLDGITMIRFTISVPAGTAVLKTTLKSL